MPEGLQFSLILLAALVFLGGFAFGTQWNVRKGDGVLKWIRQGLPLVGEKTTMRWLGSSVIELKIQKAKEPFRNAETLVVLEPRDVFFLWAFFHLRGRRDILIFRAQLRNAPRFEFEAFDPRAWTANRIERDVTKKNWTQLNLAVPLLHAYCSGDSGANAAKPLIDLAERAGGTLVRLSVHRTVPNLEIHWLMPDTKSNSSRDWFTNLRQIGEDTLKM